MLTDLLKRGYFPKELPRPFNTGSYASLLAGNDPPASWGRPNVGRSGKYSLARFGIFRRPLSICNPIHFYGLSKELSSCWETVEPLVSGTALSATAPTLQPVGRALQGRIPLRNRPQKTIETRLGRRYILQTDISRFYSSIYTHAIPWAFHGKATAKSNRSSELLGNRIDYWVRQGQDQQTVGIPIGPDTSLVLAEALMQRCDERLISEIPQIKGHRYIDDYELSFHSRTDAEDAYQVLEACLSQFELALNPKKTEIIELPAPLEATWSVALKRFPIRTSKSGIAHDLENYFSLAFDLHQRHRDESVLQYALARLRGLEVPELHWKKMQQLLLLCVAPEPACFPYAIDLIVEKKNGGLPILRDEISEAIEHMILEHAVVGHSSEVANALWAALALRIRVSAKAMKAACTCDDPVVALLALDLRASGLYKASMDTDLWQSYMTVEELYGENWLLAYEARLKNWLPSNDARDHVFADPSFAFLRQGDVSFYDTKYTSQRSGRSPRPRLPTQGARHRNRSA